VARSSHDRRSRHDHGRPDGPPEGEDLRDVQETLRGNPRAFNGIVERYTPLLYSLSYRMLGSPEDAEEAVQEIFLRVYRSLGRYRLSRRFHPWIYTIALNWIRSNLRRKRRRRRREPALPEFPAEEQAAGREKDPAQLMEEKEGERVAQEAIDGLRPAYREVFVLRHIEALSIEEIAGILNKPPGTVKTHLHRARRELAQVLARQGWRET
jgi:RNA polymerase sigma-70 factor (ECF subfamily)